jgi:hypothetical protein
MPENYKGRVSTRVNPEVLLDPATFPVHVAGGFALPRSFGASAELNDQPGVGIDVEIQVEGDHAVPLSVTVTTKDGVSWEILSRIPVRDIVGTACLAEIRRARRQDDGSFVWVPVGAGDVDATDEIRAAVQALVRYNPDFDSLERVAS